MNKILLLGGSIQQIPAIGYAKNNGYYTVLCDYLQDNPGQYYADKFYCTSTTDIEAILSVARKENVDGIVAYASDPAAPTAAYVAEKMGIPTNPYKSVETLAYKDKFREFLKENKFNCPRAQKFNNYDEVKESINHFEFPIMVKPTDSSGSKGVSRVDSKDELEKAVKTALDNSRSKSILVEEFIVQDHPYMIAGDCFVVDGKVEYWGLLNSHRDKKVNSFVPVGTSYPILLSEKRLKVVRESIQRLFDLLDIKFGAFNIEIMFDRKDNLYFIEMGPRNGGNMIPDLLYMATGVDMIAATVESALGNKYYFEQNKCFNKYLATHVLHTSQNGILKGVKFKNNIEQKIIKKVMYKKDGDIAEYFDGANKAIGIIFIEFASLKEMLEFMDNTEKWIEVIVE